MYLLDGGELEVSGFHGKILAKMNGGKARFQLTEVYGDSLIEALGDTPEELVINVSDFVLENNSVNVEAARIELESRLEEYKQFLESEQKLFRLENANQQATDEDRLMVVSKGMVRLGQMSWTDTLRLKFNR